MVTHNAEAVRAICFAAIRGERVPEDLDNNVIRASLIRGIRLHYDFAVSGEVATIASTMPSIARACNARMIMNNVVPQDMAEDQQPYCIWYPYFATENTYRTLVQAYPQMRYGVGRACAAAGYDSLYSELDLLPDVSIAEEARESGTEGGRRIYESIMSRPFRYAVMDDFMLSSETENPPFPAFLNGDTEVRWQLEPRFTVPWTSDSRLPCIEEDMHANDEHVNTSTERECLNEDEVKLLYEPLPPDLPTVKKTLLIEMAAFEGNVDRYSRLAEPRRTMDQFQLMCVIRGIYHHTMYARWWANQIAQNTLRAQTAAETDRKYVSHLDKIKMAISARRIMLNDPREFYDAGWPSDAPQPYFIWWPLRPNHNMLELLAVKVPSMKEQAAVAAIFCDYEDSYRAMEPTPDGHLWLAALKSGNPFYREDLEKRAAEQGINLESGLSSQDPIVYCLEVDHEPTSIFPSPFNYPVNDGISKRSGPYDEGCGPDTNEIEFKIWEGLAGT
ncbi:hypothetical protein F5Y12DRAFT_776503 [Xylaria sp. FL1777]|nr:hypothetical protein F5Y12DRAFT_776503 [Xylaria sp. FL1777]